MGLDERSRFPTGPATSPAGIPQTGCARIAAPRLGGMDQAATLRRMSEERGGAAAHVAAEPAPPLVVAVASGKGGVGKTNLVANLGVALVEAGERVLAIDGDLGLANLDLTLGVTAEHSLLDLLDGRVELDGVLARGCGGVVLLPACSGRYDLANLAPGDRGRLFSAIDGLAGRFDAVLIDTAAGIGANAVAFAAAAHQVLVVTTPEPTALADAYAFIKVLSGRTRVGRVSVVANLVSGPSEGEEVFRRLCQLAERFLAVNLDYLGAVTRDAALVRSVRARTPILVAEPRAPASQAIRCIAHKLLRRRGERALTGGVQLFWRQVLAVEGAA